MKFFNFSLLAFILIVKRVAKEKGIAPSIVYSYMAFAAIISYCNHLFLEIV